MNTRILLASLALPALATTSAEAQMAPPDANPLHVQEGTYKIEPAHTRVLCDVSHLGCTTWYGEFTNTAGALTIDPKKVADLSLDIIIPANTVTTTNTKLDGELNSAQWLDTAKYPTIEFKAEKIVRTGHDTARVVGQLTFHGVAKPETLNVTFNAGGINPVNKLYTIGFNATGELKRSDFNEAFLAPMIGDNVSLIISAAFVKS